MIKFTKQQLQDLFDSGKSWETMASEFSQQTNMKISPIMVKELFKANGFNPKNRKRTKAAWCVVIEDVDFSQTETVSETTEEYA